jgi:hypothetical protein
MYIAFYLAKGDGRSAPTHWIASTNPSLAEKNVCRKLDFQLNKAMASKIVLGTQNSRNYASATHDQHMPNPSSTVFRSRSKKGTTRFDLLESR